MTRIGINTIVNSDVYKVSQSNFLSSLAELPIDLQIIEVRKELFPKNEEERQAEYLSILETGLVNKWEIFYSIPEGLFVKEGLNPQFTEWLDEARALKATAIKCNIGEINGIEHTNKQELENLLEEYAIQLTIENNQTKENGPLSAVLKAVEKVREKQLPIGYTFDLGNWLVMEEDPREAFKALKEEITVMHLKNMNQLKEPVYLDDGVIEWRKYLSREQPIILEYPMELRKIESEAAKVQEAVE
jgi:hypothetical protein